MSSGSWLLLPCPTSFMSQRCKQSNLLFVPRYHVLKMFTPFGKIKREEFLWHTHGPKRGEPRGYAFVEYATREVWIPLLPEISYLALANTPCISLHAHLLTPEGTRVSLAVEGS